MQILIPTQEDNHTIRYDVRRNNKGKGKGNERRRYTREDTIGKETVQR